MAMWNPNQYRRSASHNNEYHYPLMPHRGYPHHMFDIFDTFDSAFEVPSQWLAQMTQERPPSAGRTTEIVNTDDRFKINLHVEDYKPDELNVKVVRDRFLVVEGKKREQRVNEGEQGFVTGIVAQEFSRSFVIPQGVDVNQIKSNINSGILTIQAPKTQQPAIKHERQIAIESGGESMKSIEQAKQ